jgi:hypothetical protein
MTAALRFAKGAAAGHANAMASLALMRALTHQLLQTKRLNPDDIELIREHAIGEITACADDPTANEARLLILHEFP